MGIRNIFEREREKPAMLIRDAWVDVIDWDVGIGSDFNGINIALKLSQELDGSPGLLLPVASYGNDVHQATNAGAFIQPLEPSLTFHAQGTVWAPRVVGVRVDEQGTFTAFQFNLFLDYEMIMIPWWDWIVLWDFLDNVTDLENQY